MNLPRRQLLHLTAGAAALPITARIALALDYPVRPVRIIVGFAPGGGTDIMARLIGQWLSERLGQQFIIENRPGGVSNIGTEMVVNAPPDGYTLLVATFVNAVNATLYHKLNFNFIRDIAPVASIAREPFAIEVHPSVPVKTVPEFVAYAKANPGKINMGSAGIGSGNHVAGELFKMMTGVNLVHVPYRGAGPALVDLLGGQVSYRRCFPRNSRHRRPSGESASRHAALGSGWEAGQARKNAPGGFARFAQGSGRSGRAVCGLQNAASASAFSNCFARCSSSVTIGMRA
jgi:tripartite-type tricarboxylate transporter receptor subunit TctC